MILVDKPADRTEWLKVRHSYFNASDAGCLYGVHPFKSLADVALDKLQPEPDDAEPTEAMDRGNRLEPAILQWFADRHGCQVVTPDYLPVTGKIMATLDGVIVGNDDVWIEAKTTRDYWSPIPEYVYWQVVAQAAASGRRTCHVAWIDASMQFQTQAITPTEDEIANVLARAEEFMAHIEFGMMPDEVDLETRHLRRMFPKHEEGSYIELGDTEYAQLVEWELLRQSRLETSKAEDAAKDVVTNLIRDAEGLTYGGKLVCTWKTNARGQRVLRSTRMLEVF